MKGFLCIKNASYFYRGIISDITIDFSGGIPMLRIEMRRRFFEPVNLHIDLINFMNKEGFANSFEGEIGYSEHVMELIFRKIENTIDEVLQKEKDKPDASFYKLVEMTLL